MAVLKVPVTKAKGGFIEIDTEAVPQSTYEEALALGFKVLANRGTSKITAAEIPDAATREHEAMLMAEKQKELIMSGNIKFTGKKSSTKTSGAVMTEARRLAKAIIKDQIREAGEKISHYEAKEITAAANALLEVNPELIAKAEENLKARAEVPVKLEGVLSGMKVSPKRVAAAEAKKATKKDTLSAKQAGKPAKHKPKQKPAPEAGVPA